MTRVPGVALCIALGVCGCSKSVPTPSPTPAPTHATVNLQALLQSRIRAEAFLALPAGQAVPLTTLVRPASLVPLVLTQTAGWEQAQRRRLQGRTEVTRANQRGIQEFSTRLRERQDRFLEISKSYFEDQERPQARSQADDDRKEAMRTVSEEVARLKDDLSLAQTQYQISRALASPANDTLLAPDEPEKVAKEVKRLRAIPLRAQIQVDALTGVRRARVAWENGVAPRNARVLYAASRDALETLCQELEDTIKRAELQAEQKRLQSAQERESEIKQRVEQRLEGLRSRDETFSLRLDQEESLNRVLLAEELPTRRAAGTPPSSGLPVRPRGPSPQLEESRPAKRENNEQKALVAELRAQVEDIAKRRGIIVSFSPLPGVPDRTREFANWIKVSL